MTSLRIGIVIASVRTVRKGEKFAKWIHGVAAARPDVELELLDLREYALPPYSYELMPFKAEASYTDDVARRWSERVHALDGFIVVTPEYNHGYPGQLKNAIDHVFAGWFYKPIAFVSYGGNAAGARAVEQLRQVAIEVRMVPVRGEVNISVIGLATDDAGAPTAPHFAQRANAMLDQLLWWARAAKAARAAERPPT
jgi:NAD(P)H-dependent FMN reductase